MDCKINEEVLLVPWAFGFEGDNPMQSEVTSHIGLTGVRFCRICLVRGKDSSNRGHTTLATIERRLEFMQVRASVLFSLFYFHSLSPSWVSRATLNLRVKWLRLSWSTLYIRNGQKLNGLRRRKASRIDI